MSTNLIKLPNGFLLTSLNIIRAYVVSMFTISSRLKIPYKQSIVIFEYYKIYESSC